MTLELVKGPICQEGEKAWKHNAYIDLGTIVQCLGSGSLVNGEGGSCAEGGGLGQEDAGKFCAMPMTDSPDRIKCPQLCPPQKGLLTVNMST